MGRGRIQRAGNEYIDYMGRDKSERSKWRIKEKEAKKGNTGTDN